MLARFYWCGAASGNFKPVKTPYDAFRDPSSWIEYGPIIAWDMTISTADHSAEASVTLAIDSDLTPAQSDMVQYGNGSINVGDSVFVNDSTSTAMPWGWVIIHGTVDKVDYESHQVKVHFRNPMSWLADQRVRPGPVDSGANLPVGIPYIHQLLPAGGSYRYEPNYSSLPTPPQFIIAHFIQFLCSNVWGGPFVSSTFGPNAVGDGGRLFGTIGSPITPNYMNTNLSILSTMIELGRSVRWSDQDDKWGHEIVANPVPLGQGFSTDLFIFRRGFTSSGLILDYTGSSGTHDIIDYSFPEQSLDVPTSANGFGSGDITVDETDLALKMETDALSTIGRWIALIPRNGTVLAGAGRGGTKFNFTATDKTSLTTHIVGNTPGIGSQSGFRVGDVRVGGFLDGFPLIPGYTAVVNIPQIGLFNATLVIDEFSYSEPEGITTISFNRSNSDTLQGKIQAMQEQTNQIAAANTAKADSGWFRADGSNGLFDTNSTPTAPASLIGVAGGPIFVKPIFPPGSTSITKFQYSFSHKLGVSPSKVEVIAGVVNADVTSKDVDPNSLVEVTGLIADFFQNQWAGGRVSEKNTDTVTVTVAPYLGYSEYLSRKITNGASDVDPRGWISTIDPNAYVRIKVYP